MNILDLPDEILFHIISLAGSCREYRLVSKHFYEVFCRFTSCKVKFDSVKIHDAIIDSMAMSLRRPFKLTIVNHVDQTCSNAAKLNKIVKRFAVYVKNLELSSHNAIGLADIEFLLVQMVNVVEITLNELELDGNGQMTEECSLLLPKLEKLIVRLGDEKCGNVDFSFSIRASKLQDFAVCFDDWRIDFTEFFQYHKTIKRVTMSSWDNISYPKALKQLQLSHLNIFTDDVKSRRKAMKYQPMLKHLSFYLDDDPFGTWCEGNTRSRVNDEDIPIISKMTELETLRIEIGKLSLTVFAEIGNLKNLNELVLKLIGGDDSDCFILDDFQFFSKHLREFVHFQEMFQKLISIPFPQLETFTWSVKNTTSFDEFFVDNEFMELYFTLVGELGHINVFESLAVNFPNLKRLKIEMTTSAHRLCFSMQAVLKLFPHMHTLVLDVPIVFERGNFPMHANMRHLAINRLRFHQLIKVMYLMPNLQSLEITDKSAHIQFDYAFVKAILEAIPRCLTHLRLNFGILGDFDRFDIQILNELIAKLQSCKIGMSGNCDLNKLSVAIDQSIKREIRGSRLKLSK